MSEDSELIEAAREWLARPLNVSNDVLVGRFIESSADMVQRLADRLTALTTAEGEEPTDARERLEMLIAVIDDPAFNHLPIISRANAKVFQADIRALLSSTAERVGEGDWVLVPREPTHEMVQAARNADIGPDRPMWDNWDSPSTADKDEWEAVLPGITKGSFFHASYEWPEWQAKILEVAYRAMLAVAPPHSAARVVGD